jgi:hypothetical protein
LTRRDYRNEYDALDDQWEKRRLRAYQGFTVKPWLWGTFGTVAGIVVACAAIFLLCYGIFELNWFFGSRSYSRQDRAITHSFGNQQSYRDQINSDVTVVFSLSGQIASDPAAAVTLRVQRANVVVTICGLATGIDGGLLPDCRRIGVDRQCPMRLVPTRRGVGAWFPSWKVTGWAAAQASATEFLAAEKIPVLICETDEHGHSRRHLKIIGGARRPTRGRHAA